MHVRNSWERESARSRCGFGRMLEALSVLFDIQGGEAEAAPLAADIQSGRTRCRARPVPQRRCRILRASYILERMPSDRADSLSQRPRGHKATRSKH